MAFNPSPNAPSPGPPSQPSFAFIRRLDDDQNPPFRVNLVDRGPDGIGVDSMVPLALDSRIVVNIADTPPRQILLLGRVAHCTKLPTGRFQIAVAVLDRCEGNLHNTPIPLHWRQS